jgi:hypothetical protein
VTARGTAYDEPDLLAFMEGKTLLDAGGLVTKGTAQPGHLLL